MGPRWHSDLDISFLHRAEENDTPLEGVVAGIHPYIPKNPKVENSILWPNHWSDGVETNIIELHLGQELQIFKKIQNWLLPLILSPTEKFRSRLFWNII